MKRYFLLLPLLIALSCSSVNATWTNEILYFVMLDRFADGDEANNKDVDLSNEIAFHGGDLRGLSEHLDYIHELGATAIWITPINQQIDGFVKNEHGDFYAHHGYWTEDFCRIDPRFGSEADLKALVERAHRLGMKVILDVVYNHVGYGADFKNSHGHWLRLGEQCGGDAVTQCLSGLPDLRTELPEVKEYLFEAHLGLAERTGLDGFRLDTVKHIAHDFWQQHRQAARARLGDDFMLLGEIWGADKRSARQYFDKDELDGVFDFVYRDRTLNFFNRIGSAKRYGRYLSKRHEVLDGHFLAPFLSNHDMPTLLAMFGGDKDKYLAAATVLLAIEGMPVITWGEEFARQGKAWPKNRDNMFWRDEEVLPGAIWQADLAVRGKFRQLIALRKSTTDLSSHPTKVLYASDHLLVLQRGDNTLLVVNRSEEVLDWPKQLDGKETWQLAFSSAQKPVDSLAFIGSMQARIYIRAN